MKKIVLLLIGVFFIMKMSAFFEENPEKYWDFEKLKNPPHFIEDDDAGSNFAGLRSIVFDGAYKNGVQTKVFAYIGLPDTPMPEGGYPAILLVHGGGGTAFVWAVKLWNSYGYAVLAPDWYGRRPDASDHDADIWSHDRRLVSHDGSHEIGDIAGHVSKVENLVLAHSLLRSIPEVNPDKIAYVGLSWGSWYGAMVTAVDNRFQGVVEIYLGDLKDDDTFINGRFLHAVKNKMYYVVGTNDVHGSPESMQASFDACGDMLGNKSMNIELPHSHVGFKFQTCRRYADHILLGAPNLPELENAVVAEGKITSKVKGEGKGIKKVFLCCTFDRDEEVYHKRKWHFLPAEYKDGMISADLPENVFQCYLAAYDEDDVKSYCCGSSNVVNF